MWRRPVGRMPERTRDLFLFVGGFIVKSKPFTTEGTEDTEKYNPRASLCLQQLARDDGALHFASALVNRNHAGVAIIALDVAFARIAEAAVDLHGFVRDAIHHLAGVKFRARRERARARHIVVAHPRRLMEQ